MLRENAIGDVCTDEDVPLVDNIAGQKVIYHPRTIADFAAASSNACLGAFIP
jgi:hypothetical protein